MESRQPIIETFEKYAQLIFVGNNSDMFVYPNIPDDLKWSFGNLGKRTYSMVDLEETVLFVRDTSAWNSRDKGVVMTDKRIIDLVHKDCRPSIFYGDIKEAFYKMKNGEKCKNFKESEKNNVQGFGLDITHYGGREVVWSISDFVKGGIDKLINPIALIELFENLSAITEELKNCKRKAFDALTMVSLCEDVDIREVERRAEVALDYVKDERDLMDINYNLARAYYNWSKIISVKKAEVSYDSQEYKELQEQYDNALDLFESHIDNAIENMGDLENGWFAEFAYWKALALQNRKHYLDATRLAIHALDFLPAPDEKDQLFRIISGKYAYGQIHTGSGYGFTAKTKEDYLRIAHEESVELWSMEDWKEEFSDKEIKNNIISDDNDAAEFVKTDMGFFSNRPYFDRQFIFTVKDIEHIAGCYDETDNIKYVIPIDEMPGDITFPFGHPQANTLYYAHPLRPHYVPVESASLALFHEKVQEICRLFQCLGATEITTRTLKGHKISETYSDNSSLEGEVGYKFFGASGSFGKGGNGSNNNERRDEMSLTQTFEPTRSPYCPDDLMWAAHDPEIQTFIKQRLNGGLLTFSKKVSSSETMNMSSHQKMEVKAAFNSLITKVTTNYNSESDNTFNEENETVWEISVVFKPITEFNESDDADCMTSQDSTTLSDQEQRYLEEYKAVLEDGEITDRERRSLDRYAVSLGISTERAVQLETSINEPSLTKEEQEYLDEYKYMLEDGEIGERERRTLERLRNRLGLSEETVAKLERSVITPSTALTTEEQDYVDEYKLMLEDGEIGERERRTLERLRTRNGISAERAKELEALK